MERTNKSEMFTTKINDEYLSLKLILFYINSFEKNEITLPKFVNRLGQLHDSLNNDYSDWDENFISAFLSLDTVLAGKEFLNGHNEEDVIKSAVEDLKILTCQKLGLDKDSINKQKSTHFDGISPKEIGIQLGELLNDGYDLDKIVFWANKLYNTHKKHFPSEYVEDLINRIGVMELGPEYVFTNCELRELSLRLMDEDLTWIENTSKTTKQPKI